MTIQEYLTSLKGKTAAVLGIGVSNTPLIELLCRSGVQVVACDKKSREALGERAAQLEALGARLCLGEHYLDDLRADVIFRTPGMRPDVPALLKAKKRGSIVTSEMEIFFEVCPCTIIGVTGSDGKTTTTSIIADMLRVAGKTVYLGGNIGHPLLCDAEKMQRGDIAVVELSSFQLLDMKRSPHIAVMTNLAPNHLDMHRDMAEYIEAKENIYLHQSADDIAIFNEDNDITRALSEKSQARTRLFSRREAVAPGARIVKMEVRVTHEQLSRLLARHNGQLQRDPLLHAVLFDGAERGVLIAVRPRNGIVEAVLAVNAVFHDQAAGSLGILRVQMPAPHQLDQRGIFAQLVVAILIVAAQTGQIPLRNGFECQHGTCYLL